MKDGMMIERISNFILQLLFFILWTIGVSFILIITGILYLMDIRTWRTDENENDRRTRKKI